MKNLKNLIERHSLTPHPEGGFYKETYRSTHSTGIFYLLEHGDTSKFHRIKSDEMWHFYEGDSLTVVEIEEDGSLKETILSPENVQYVVLAGKWFGAYVPDGSEYAFVGCTVAPAFNFEDFEIGNEDELLRDFPNAAEMIKKLKNGREDL